MLCTWKHSLAPSDRQLLHQTPRQLTATSQATVWANHSLLV